MNNNISDEIETIVKHNLNRLPFPLKGTVSKVYTDNNHIDIKTDMGLLSYVETVGNSPVKGKTVVLLFLNGNDNDYIGIL